MADLGKICLPEWISNKQSLKHCEAPTQWIKSENLISPPGSLSDSLWHLGSTSSPLYFNILFSKKIIMKRDGIDSLSAQPMPEGFILFYCVLLLLSKRH